MSDGLVLAAGAAVPLAVTSLLFGEGGWMNISRADTVHAALTSLVVALVVPWPAVRVGAVLSAVGVVAAFGVHTPVGLNATRLATMFALPVVAACARPGRLPRLPGPRWAWLGVVLAALVLWQPPVLTGDLRDRGNPTADPGYFAPLRAELAGREAARRAAGDTSGARVEIPPTRDYWEAAYAGGAVPLARGWLRQVELARSPSFFDGTLTPQAYRDWLTGNGVRYVAVADARPTWFAKREIALIITVPYLREVWRGEHWTLYEVEPQPGAGPGRTGIVPGGGLVSADAASLVVDVDGPLTPVRVRWSRWLTVRGPAGACLTRAPDGWTQLRTRTPGRYTISSALTGTGPRC